MRRLAPVLVCLTAMVAGCGADANYTLQLIPHVPFNVDPFEGGPTVHVRTLDLDGTYDWTPVGTLETGTLSSDGFGVLAGTRVGIALGGGTDLEPDLLDLSAWGESPPVNLSKGKEQQNVDVLVAPTHGVGTLGDLRDAAFGAAPAVLSDGTVYLFGGASTDGGECKETVRKLANLASGDWSFEPVDALLPAKICYASTNVVQLNGREQIVITGGEELMNAWNRRTTMVAIFDPSSETLAWAGNLTLSRSRHRGYVMPSGNIMYVSASQSGGSAAAPNHASWEIFDPTARGGVREGTLDAGRGVAFPPWDVMVTQVDDSLMLCGGATWIGQDVTPTSQCALLNERGETEALPDLPWRLRAGALATLADGRVLLAGGINAASRSTNAPSGPEAWIIDLNADAPAWVPVDRMGSSRAYFQLIPNAVGGAIAIGGAGSAWAFGGIPADLPACGERFIPDGDGGSWQPLEPCSPAGQGLVPTWGGNSRFGAFLVQGRPDEGGGKTYGIVSTGPGL